MARAQAPGAPSTPRRIVFVGVLIMVLAAAAVALYLAWDEERGAVLAEDLTGVVVMAAAPDDDGSVVAQVIAVADLSTEPATLESVSPALIVTIPGTTYSTLADAYPFGGGAGTAEALARAEGGDPLPYVALGPDELSALVEAAGGIDLRLPAAMSVFDGDDLFTFEPGSQTLSAEELSAVLKGAPYLTKAERAELDAELGAALATLLADDADALAAADTNLGADALEVLRLALGGIER